MKLLKKYYFEKLENYDKKEIICSMTTDNVKLNINYQNNTYKLTYMMFASTEKYFDYFQRVFSPDDFNLNFLVQDQQVWNDIGIKKISVQTVSIQYQLLGCEEHDLPTYGSFVVDF
jgi:hypothetical protein